MDQLVKIYRELLTPLLNILAVGSFYSADFLSVSLQISSPEVLEAIQQLKQAGVEIETHIDHGYRIPGGLELLNQNQILQQLCPSAKFLLDDLRLLDKIDSTNNYLLRQINNEHVIAVLAEQQTQGKGQRGKSWVTPFAKHIACSLLWPFAKPPGEILGLPLAVAVAIARGLQHYGINQDLSLKWPNDVYHQGRKLGGILIETVANPYYGCKVVIGFGVNIYLSPQQASSIDQPWTCAENILNTKIERNRLVGILLNELLIALPQFASQGLDPFLSDWQKLDYLFGKRIHLTTAQQSLSGIMQGVSRFGELLLLDDHHQQHVCLNGSVHLANAL